MGFSLYLTPLRGVVSEADITRWVAWARGGRQRRWRTGFSDHIILCGSMVRKGRESLEQGNEFSRCSLVLSEEIWGIWLISLF